VKESVGMGEGTYEKDNKFATTLNQPTFAKDVTSMALERGRRPSCQNSILFWLALKLEISYTISCYIYLEGLWFLLEDVLKKYI
jgi:hypothetical protein